MPTKGFRTTQEREATYKPKPDVLGDLRSCLSVEEAKAKWGKDYINTNPNTIIVMLHAQIAMAEDLVALKKQIEQVSGTILWPEPYGR